MGIFWSGFIIFLLWCQPRGVYNLCRQICFKGGDLKKKKKMKKKKKGKV